MRDRVHLGFARTACHFYRGDLGHLWYVLRCNLPHASGNPITLSSVATNHLPLILVAITEETLDNSCLMHNWLWFLGTKHHNAYPKCDYSAPKRMVTYTP